MMMPLAIRPAMFIAAMMLFASHERLPGRTPAPPI